MGFSNLIADAVSQHTNTRPSQPIEDQSMDQFQKTLPSMSPNYSSGKGGNVTYSATSGQPKAGNPNQYSNTVGQWDNSGNQSNRYGGGKGKGY